jgi:hypothetical protein
MDRAKLMPQERRASSIANGSAPSLRGLRKSAQSAATWHAAQAVFTWTRRPSFAMRSYPGFEAPATSDTVVGGRDPLAKLSDHPERSDMTGRGG